LAFRKDDARREDKGGPRPYGVSKKNPRFKDLWTFVTTGIVRNHLHKKLSKHEKKTEPYKAACLVDRADIGDDDGRSITWERPPEREGRCDATSRGDGPLAQ